MTSHDYVDVYIALMSLGTAVSWELKLLFCAVRESLQAESAVLGVRGVSSRCLS